VHVHFVAPLVLLGVERRSLVFDLGDDLVLVVLAAVLDPGAPEAGDQPVVDGVLEDGLERIVLLVHVVLEDARNHLPGDACDVIVRVREAAVGLDLRELRVHHRPHRRDVGVEEIQPGLRHPRIPVFALVDVPLDDLLGLPVELLEETLSRLHLQGPLLDRGLLGVGGVGFRGVCH
jgi:hypothetical protein